jgi:hypothetical protein
LRKISPAGDHQGEGAGAEGHLRLPRLMAAKPVERRLLIDDAGHHRNAARHGIKPAEIPSGRHDIGQRLDRHAE